MQTLLRASFVTSFALLAYGAAAPLVFAAVDPSLSVTNASVVYTGSAQAAIVSGSADGVVSNVLYDGSPSVPTNVGTYVVTADFTPTDTVAYNTLAGASAGNFDITQAPSTTSITCAPSSSVYSGFVKKPCTVVITGTGGMSSTNQSFFIQYSSNINAGTATASYTYAGDTNYASSTDNKNFIIRQAPLTVTADNQTKIYGASDPTLTYSADALLGFDTTAIFSGALARAATESVGTTSIALGTLTAGGNYTVTYAPAVFTITIDPIAASVLLATSTNPDTTLSATIPSSTTSSTTANGFVTTVDIPANVVITGPATWNGAFALPVVTTTYTSPPTRSSDGFNPPTVVSAIEIGASDTPLTFDQAIKITFVGQAGKLIGWSQLGVFHQITSVCDSTTTPTLAVGTACRIDDGADLLVWTKHFSTYVVYTEAHVAVTPTSGGGGGGGGSIMVVSTPSSLPQLISATSTQKAVAVPAEGSVLGAAGYNFTQNLSLGSHGADVAALQQYLHDVGYPLPSGVTGYFGQETFAAVSAFQKVRGIPSTGFVGALTRAELNKGVIAATPEMIPQKAKTSLSVGQASAIVSLLESFGADAATLAKVRAVLGL